MVVEIMIFTRKERKMSDSRHISSIAKKAGDLAETLNRIADSGANKPIDETYIDHELIKAVGELRRAAERLLLFLPRSVEEARIARSFNG